jgi:hypothetical protein
MGQYMGSEEGSGPVTLCVERKCHVQGYDWEIDTTADERGVGPRTLK